MIEDLNIKQAIDTANERSVTVGRIARWRGRGVTIDQLSKSEAAANTQTNGVTWKG